MSGPVVVALGGGHGLAVTLEAWRRVTPALTAVVTVADDGGSSGALRASYGCLPPGDLRMAVTALCAPEGPPARWAQLLQHRYPDGPLAGHAVGNLLLLAAWQRQPGDPVDGLDTLVDLVGASGRVLPMSTRPLHIVADVLAPGARDPHEVRGQHAVAVAPGHVVEVRLDPAAPPACPQAVDAVAAADVVVLGPGSWFSSVLPHLLVPDLAAALATTKALRVVTLNLAAQPGETDGFSPETHLEVLSAYAPTLGVDVVLADDAASAGHPRLADAAAALGARLVLAPLARGDGTARHDPDALAAAYGALVGHGRIPPWR